MNRSAFTWTDGAGARSVPFRPGQSVAAALTQAGVRAFRDTREPGPGRGIFCGMGVCQDCLVQVDGDANRRACMIKAGAGLDVRRQDFPGTPALPLAAPPPPDAKLPQPEPMDLLIVGGGAAGLSAAIAARLCGLDVMLLDDRTTPGGQYYKQRADAAPPMDAQQRAGAALLAQAEESGATIMRGAEVWGAFAPDSLGVHDGHRSRILAPRTLIVATGAHERGVPMPGWTLPGVMTVGAAQTLWRSHGVVPGQRIVVAGNGPLNIQVAAELAAGGARIVALAEASAPPRVADAIALAAAGPALAAHGARMVLALAAKGARVRHRTRLIAVEQADGALLATLDGPAGEAQHMADAVLVNFGFHPANEILRALGADAAWDATRGHLVTRRDADGMTSVPGLYAAGDCAGMSGAPAARADGIIAAIAAARRLGRAVPANAARMEASARAALPRHRRFQQALWRLFAAERPGLDLAADDTLVCRCEEVSKATIIGAIAASPGGGPPDIGSIKRATRCGMGRCQGRYCAPVLAEHLAYHHGATLDDRALFAPRAPIKPIVIADLVAAPPAE